MVDVSSNIVLYFFEIQTLVTQEKTCFHGIQDICFIADIFWIKVYLEQCNLFYVKNLMKKLILVFLLVFAISGCATGESVTQSITVSTPQPNTEISSPLTITGEAVGTWFFEATFPVELVDANGAVIAQGLVQALSDWQTEELVPFEGTLEFTTDALAGELILSKDNPSGLPENDEDIKIPVTFSK